MKSRSIDAENSEVHLRTGTRGLLAKLAHDLEVSATEFTGQVRLGEGDSWSAELSFSVSGLRVLGVRRGARVDRTVLSMSDREEIERKIQTEVLPGETVKVQAHGDRRDAAEATVSGPQGSQRVGCALSRVVDGEQLVVQGSVQLSLRRLGVAEIKGPLGAFKVHDCVDVHFRFAC